MNIIVKLGSNKVFSTRAVLSRTNNSMLQSPMAAAFYLGLLALVLAQVSRVQAREEITSTTTQVTRLGSCSCSCFSS